MITVVLMGMSRDRWESQALWDLLERWISNSSCRKIVRKSVDFNDTVQFLLFPHPEDAEAMNLTGPGGELPAALMAFKDEDNHVLHPLFVKFQPHKLNLLI